MPENNGVYTHIRGEISLEANCIVGTHRGQVTFVNIFQTL